VLSPTWSQTPFVLLRNVASVMKLDLIGIGRKTKYYILDIVVWN